MVYVTSCTVEWLIAKDASLVPPFPIKKEKKRKKKQRKKLLRISHACERIKQTAQKRKSFQRKHSNQVQ
jgi:hypothetical protein